VQDIVKVDPASDRGIAAALCGRIKQLLQPVHSKLMPQGPCSVNLLERFAARPSTARDKDKESKVSSDVWFPRPKPSTLNIKSYTLNLKAMHTGGYLVD
jgi:hypothetical protein